MLQGRKIDFSVCGGRVIGWQRHDQRLFGELAKLERFASDGAGPQERCIN